MFPHLTQLPRGAALALLLCAPLGQHLFAQGLDDRRVGLFVGYTYIDAENPNNLNSRLGFDGGQIGLYVAQTPWLRWTGDFAAGANAGILGPTIYYGLAGPEFTKRTGRATFFAHALFGYGEEDGGLIAFKRSGFGMAFGGGVDAKLNSRFSLRAIQVDYLPSRFGGQTEALFGTAGPFITSWQNNLRVSTSIVVKFGHNP
jgi:hypothetical protein